MEQLLVLLIAIPLAGFFATLAWQNTLAPLYA
jgi:hypothetical protein